MSSCLDIAPSFLPVPLFLGLVSVPIPFTVGQDTLCYILRQANVRLVVCR